MRGVGADQLRAGAVALAIGAVLTGGAGPTAFSQAVSEAAPGWVAEDWRQGLLKLHPSQFTWQSDVYLELQAPEPAAGRAAQAALQAAWADAEADDKPVDMAGASEVAPGVLARRLRWKFAFDDNLSLWGVVTTARGFVPFHLNCEYANPGHGGGEACLRSALTLVISIQQGRLSLPEPPMPLSIAGWESQYLADGRSVAVRSSFNGLRRATITVTPPTRIEPGALRAATERFASSLDEAEDKQGSPPTWLGPAADAWLRRTFPASFEGPAIQMAGPTPSPDGLVDLIGVRCPNAGWIRSCAAGAAQAIQQVRSGELERRRQAAIAATQTPLPRDGLDEAEIVGVYTEGRTMVGSGFVVDGHLYLKNGTVVREFDRPPALIRPRGDDAKQWGKWRRDGDRIAVVWGDGRSETVEVTGSNLMVGGAAGMVLDGHYRHVGGGGTVAFGGGSSFLAEQDYRFYPDGSFTSSRSSSFLVGPAPGAAVAAGGSAGPGARGRYRVDGYTLTLTYPDGRLSRLAFAAYAHEMANPQRGGLLLNGVYFFREE